MIRGAKEPRNLQNHREVTIITTIAIIVGAVGASKASIPHILMPNQKSLTLSPTERLTNKGPGFRVAQTRNLTTCQEGSKTLAPKP